MSRSTILVSVLSAMALAAVMATATAQERAEQAAELRFRRVYAPVDRINDWPTGEGKYLPLESAEFERLLSLARSGAADDRGSFTARIAAAEYRAKLSGEQILEGKATLEITHSGQSATTLTMEPCNAAIRRPVWLLPDQEAKAETKKTILGLGRNGKLQVLVEQSGKLAFDWSRAGGRDAGEAIIFSCEFPASPASVLRLDLPENLTPAVDKGFISGGKDVFYGCRSWRIELGGNCRFRLRLAPSGAANARPPLALLSESSVYEFSPRGVDLSAQWKIRTHDEPLEKIVVLLDPGLQLATAHLGDVSLRWTIEPLPNDAGSRAVLALPEAIQDSERILRLRALSPLVLDRPCRLPRLQSEGLFWQEGAIRLIVPDPLVIERLATISCSQRDVAPLAEPRVGESLEFQKFSPDATIELSLARRSRAMQLVTGTAVELGSGEMTARVVADFRADDGAIFTLEADVSNLWIIDSVEATPAEVLADWSLESRADKQRKLLIRLSKAPSAAKPVRLIVNGRRLRTFLTHQWGVGDLLPLRFTTPVETKRLAAITAVDPYELQLGNSEQLTRLNARNLTPAELELFAVAPAGLLFEDNAGAVELEIALQTRKPPVKATDSIGPARDTASATEPALKLSKAGKDNLPPVSVWNYQLESWCGAEDGARHLAAFKLQNTGENSLQVVLPQGVSTADVRGVWVDDLPVDWQEADDRDAAASGAERLSQNIKQQSGQEIITQENSAICPHPNPLPKGEGTYGISAKDNTVFVPLPAAKQVATVWIYFITRETRPRTFGSLTPPLLEVKAPVLAGGWTVWLPPGFEFVDDDPHRQTTHRADNREQSQLAENEKSLIPNGPAGCRPEDTQGWIVQRLELSAAQGATIKYVHLRSRQRWAAMIFILTLALGYWKAQERPILFAILTGIFGIAAFVLPESYVPLASAAVLGMLGCLLILIVRWRITINDSAATPDRGPSGESPSSSKTARLGGPTGAVLLVAAASLFFTENARAEESAENTKNAAPADYRVFVPIDAEKKPAGDKVYLPEKFYTELYRRAAEASEEPGGWLLGSAVYRGSLARESATGRLLPEAIKAQFELTVFSRMVQVRIPFRRENAELIPDGATLDGRHIQPQWESDGAALRFDVEEPGNYRLELGVRPASRNLGAWAGLEMSIPRLAQSRLELILPAEVPGIEAQSAVGVVQMQTDPPRLSAELGPSNRLAVHWPETQATGAAEAGIEVDQLTWLKVQSGSVVVDVRFKFHIPENQIRRLRLAADPRLRLLPLQGKDAPSIEIRSDGAKQQIVTLQWNRPLSDEAVIDLSFLLTGASGVGKFRLPQIEMLDVRTAKRWMAVSVDPILQYESQRSPNMETAATAEFLKNWGPANSPPLQAYRLPSDKVDWSLSTRPREPETSARQNLELIYDRNNVEAHFDAQLTVASGYVFQYQLSAPAGMKILKASVRKEGAEHSSRWSQDKDGTITIFLTGPADGKQQLSLQGIMPMESGEKTPLPSVGLQRCRVQSTTLRVFRRGDVNLELTMPEKIKSQLQTSPLPLGEDQGDKINSPLPFDEGQADKINSPLPLDEGQGDKINSPLPLGEGQGEGETDLSADRGRLWKSFFLEGDSPLQGEVRLTVNRPKTDAKQAAPTHQDSSLRSE